MAGAILTVMYLNNVKGSAKMDISVKKENDTLYVAICGEIDHHEASSARVQLDNLLFYERPKDLVFDFSKVRFMDSSGIGLVLGRYRIVKEMGGSVSITGAPRSIETIFKMSGVDKMIDIK